MDWEVYVVGRVVAGAIGIMLWSVSPAPLGVPALRLTFAQSFGTARFSQPDHTSFSKV